MTTPQFFTITGLLLMVLGALDTNLLMAAAIMLAIGGTLLYGALSYWPNRTPRQDIDCQCSHEKGCPQGMFHPSRKRQDEL